ncbi:tetratricopeptide repeat protein [Spirosoma sp. HMF4905]|uniref:Tetratricopeptide repeat protein n=1 Tax=Spirosoma arboris TaxID=2682092 RepID=A0A7K1SK25_9BACT|nr:tetratricopeptide repeat protein [Spirosoma arboris]MVM34157.1 tetratricopeptide repeat protein [Spirosoma arboris]
MNDSSNFLYRYPGTRPFVQHDERLFFGRKNDARELFKLIYVQSIVVIYGKSGYGKSSLLNAEVGPNLSREGLPFFNIRFGNFNPDPNYKEHQVTPIQAVIQEIKHLQPLDSLTGLFHEEESLWYTVKQFQVSQFCNQLVLIFDQFEEFFSYPEEQQLIFSQQLSDLFNRISFRSLIESSDQYSVLSPTKKALVRTNPIVKIVFSIRSDSLELLNKLKDLHPGILRHCYKLDAIDEANAEAAIREPARLPKSEGYGNYPFEYEDKLLKAILEAIKHNGKIDAANLQIVCRYLEKNILPTKEINKEKNLKLLELDDLKYISGGLDGIFKDFYDRSLQELDSKKHVGLAQKIIENEFVKDGKRIPFLSTYLLSRFKSDGLNIGILNKLTEVVLLHKYRDNDNREFYELAHDTLIGPVAEAAQIRKERALKKRYYKAIAAFVALAIILGGTILFFLYVQGLTISIRALTLDRDNKQKELIYKQKLLYSAQLSFAKMQETYTLTKKELSNKKKQVDLLNIQLEERRRYLELIVGKIRKVQEELNLANKEAFFNQRALIYLEKGEPLEAKNAFQRLKQTTNQYWWVNYNIGSIYQQLGQYEQADENLHAALASIEGKDPENRIRRIITMNRIAQVYRNRYKIILDKNKYGDLVNQYEKLLNDLKTDTTTSDKKLYLASVQNDLADFYTSQGEYELAEPLYVSSLSNRRTTLQSKDSRIVDIIDKLAEVYLREQKYSDAIKKMNEKINILENAYGADNYLLASAYQDLAIGYLSFGTAKDSISLRNKANSLFTLSQTLFEKKIDSKISTVKQEKLQKLYTEIGRYSTAKRLYYKEINRMDSLKDSRIVNQYVRFADFYATLSMYDSTNILYKEAIRLKQKQLTNRNSTRKDTLEYQHILEKFADTLSKHRQGKSALVYYNRIDSFRVDYFGNNSPILTNNLKKIADLSESNKSEIIYNSIIRIWRPLIGTQDNKKKQPATNKWWTQRWAMSKPIVLDWYWDDPEAYIASLDKLASLYAKRNENAAALKLYDEAFLALLVFYTPGEVIDNPETNVKVNDRKQRPFAVYKPKYFPDISNFNEISLAVLDHYIYLLQTLGKDKQADQLRKSPLYLTLISVSKKNLLAKIL